MSKRPILVLIEDMWEAIGRIEHYIRGVSQQAFPEDQRTVDAVVRNLEILGEAANRLPEDFTHQQTDIEWKKIVGLRHRIVHDYFDIDRQIVWEILQHDLPVLKAKLQQIRAAT